MKDSRYIILHDINFFNVDRRLEQEREERERKEREDPDLCWLESEMHLEDFPYYCGGKVICRFMSDGYIHNKIKYRKALTKIIKHYIKQSEYDDICHLFAVTNRNQIQSARILQSLGFVSMFPVIRRSTSRVITWILPVSRHNQISVDKALEQRFPRT